MRWLKDVVIDIAITLVIVAFALWQFEWARWIVLIYTPLLLVLKVLAVSSGSVLALSKRTGGDAPFLFHHGLYAVSVLALLSATQHLLAGAWLLIWVLSISAEVMSSRTIGPPSVAKR
jgi:hypothetical protein